MIKYLSILMAILVFSTSSFAQQISFGGATNFVDKNEATNQVSDLYAEIDLVSPIDNTSHQGEFLVLGGYGEEGDFLLGIGGRHFWRWSDNVKPSIGAQMFHFNGGGIDKSLGETTVFAGGEVGCKLSINSCNIEAMPFAAWYPAILGDTDTDIKRFGVRLSTK
jgi:hypothetical protein